MKTLLFLGLILFVALDLPRIEGKMFRRCELARKLQQRSLEGYIGRKVADWVCLAKNESGFNTRAVHYNCGSTNYGIFQISSQYWCDDGKTPNTKNACQISCGRFLDDDIEDDIRCAKMVAQEAGGLTPWVGWRRHCQTDVDYFVQGC